MWSVVRAVVAVTLLGLVTPGAIELVEDVAHFVMHGDSLHDGAHDEQHCCSGAFHVCSCHRPCDGVARHGRDREPRWNEHAVPSRA